MTNLMIPNSTNTLRKQPASLLREAYRRYPELYARQVLGLTWWEKQAEIARALLTYRRVLVKASHSIGKTHVAAGLTNWHFDCFQPGLTLTTAPTGQQVVDVLWKEVRTQRRGRPGLQPKAPRMETSAEHFAVGYTARDDNAFQGRHAEHVLIIFDEATGVEAPFWDAAEGMMTSENCYWLCILNPTDTTSRAYEEAEIKGKFHVISVSALEHPNVVAGLEGKPIPFPGAVTLGWVQERIAEWCEPIPVGDKRAADIEFPPGSGLWYRPDPLFESRALGLWPTQGAYSVWTEAMWNASIRPQEVPQEPLQIGCDVARFGDDFTSIVVRRGPCALHHETHNGWNTAQTAGRLKQLAGEYVQHGENPRQVAIQIDDDGVGGGVVDQKEGFTFLPVNGSSTPMQPKDYPNVRSEAWFATAQQANEGRLDLSRLPELSRILLRRQVMAPIWELDAQGRRVVEPKAQTKKRIGRSPDDADALNLAYTRVRKNEIKVMRW